MPLRLLAAAAILIAVAATPAIAQGRGNAFGKGRQKNPSASVTAAGEASGSTVGGPGVREFGTWLDDATVADPQSGWVAVSLGRYQSPTGHQTDFPVVDAALGWSRRLQFGLTVPYSRVSTTEGVHAGGRGDIYLAAKVSVIDRLREHGAAVAITPLVEILSDPDPLKGGRLFWGLPISGEIRFDGFRAYGTGGYFSRGVLFGSAAVEVPATDRLVTTTALTWTRSLAEDAMADALDLSASRVDLTFASAYSFNPSLAVFGSIGRTLSHIDDNGATLTLNGGVALMFARRSATPPSRRP